KIDRVEDLKKAIYTLERLREKEIEHAKKNTKPFKDSFADMGKEFGGIDFDEWLRNKEDSESIYLLKGLLERGFNYLARDFDGDIWTYKFPPVKTKTVWHENTLVGRVSEKIDDHIFPEVKWTDDKPTKIADLLAKIENGGENGKVEQKQLYYAKIKGWELATTTITFWNYRHSIESPMLSKLYVGGKEGVDSFKTKMTKEEWNKVGINDTNADFEVVSE